jgi:hypothetical protein
MPARVLRLLAVLVALLVVNPLPAASVLVAFHTDADGGLAHIELDASGHPSTPVPVVLFRDPAFAAAAKLRVSADARYATLNAETEGRANFAVVNLASSPPAAPRLLTLDFTPEEHRLDNSRAFVGGTDGNLVSLDLASGTITHRWNSRKQLTPAGHKPEDLLVLEPEGLLLVSHQKDGKKGRQGSRLVVLRLADLSLVADLPLPRDHPELHLSAKEAGPSPEVIRIDRTTNTLLLTLDLYGAVAFADLDAALAGHLKNYAPVPTSADGNWGNAFPDRVTLAAHAGKTYAFISNASADGGIAVFDLAARRRVGFLPVEAGCDYPVVLSGGRQLATVVSGKLKHRAGTEIAKDEKPAADLLLINVARAIQDDRAALTRLPLGAPATHISPVAGHDSWVALTLAGETPQLVIYDTTAQKEITRTPLPGEAASLATAP